jgi:hypothetical protein
MTCYHEYDMKNTFIAFALGLLISAGIVWFITLGPESTYQKPGKETAEKTAPVSKSFTEDTATTTVVATDDTRQMEGKEVIGMSAGGNAILAYHYGTGDTELLFVGGIHGGYEWNTSLVAFELMDYLTENRDVLPTNLRITVIPVLNPDGLEKTVGTTGRFSKADVTATLAESVPGRVNANGVDLNRNFDCEWRAQGVWQNNPVSGGSKPFSEPESVAVKAYIDAHKPTAAVVWYSAAGGVYASNCRNGVPEETTALTKLYAEASGYPAYESFDYYEITGDMVNWLAKQDIPAISVLLTNHTDTEWDKNMKGIEAMLEKFGK